VAGVGWILAENWLPYQRKTFVTTPFAGYVSGHSTYSRAGAQVLTMLTGSGYFPGGMAEYVIPANSNFLGVEAWSSTNVRLQWASYKDASDQTSLSRIWGGIHPPFGDMPGRLIGEQVGTASHAKAKTYFLGAPVPVGLMYFTAAENNCSVQLRWATAAEQQSKSFILMRSQDGLQYDTKLAEIPAAGNSSTLRNYTFTDAAPNAANFYKLLQVDADGRMNQLPVVYVGMKKCAGQGDMMVNIFPNPAKSSVNIMAAGALPGKPATISIIAMDGKLLLQKRLIAMGQTETINVSSLSSGKYMLRIVTGAAVINNAIAIMR
jgi:hypothetical protein